MREPSRRSARASAFEKARSRLKRGARRGQQEHGAGRLEQREECGTAGDPGDVADLRAVDRRDADAEPHRKRGDAQGEAADHEQGEPQRDPAEEPPAGVVELSELGDRRRRRLDAGREGHAHRERQHHREEGEAGGVAGRRDVGRLRLAESRDEKGGADADERQRHKGEQDPAPVAEPGERSD